MNFFRKILKKLSLPKFPAGTDPMAQEVMLRALQTGNVVVGSRDESGKVTVREVKASKREIPFRKGTSDT
jgi:hypothetical protein